ncbi:hypothetical protein [Streptomyces sp. NBC_01294]|uniref:hypothetical protein n=1 Tax=Streptomyces sp. NBC_01294 TaxID=2903815 RepID=UPI002DD8DA32|nr:hypothetical protein [Streptomyces sp. NBC_01294]WRZ62315.1 hypothetical protein OG534_38300 [Streptomyces sp. NBC_01294]
MSPTSCVPFLSAPSRAQRTGLGCPGLVYDPVAGQATVVCRAVFSSSVVVAVCPTPEGRVAARRDRSAQRIPPPERQSSTGPAVEIHHCWGLRPGSADEAGGAAGGGVRGPHGRFGNPRAQLAVRPSAPTAAETRNDRTVVVTICAASDHSGGHMDTGGPGRLVGELREHPAARHSALAGLAAARSRLPREPGLLAPGLLARRLLINF